MYDFCQTQSYDAFAIRKRRVPTRLEQFTEFAEWAVVIALISAPIYTLFLK
jgi:hypothetical protein